MKSNNHDLNRLTVALQSLDLIAEGHPDMKLEAALPALRALAVLAALTPQGEVLLTQAAADAYAHESVQSQLPPWE